MQKNFRLVQIQRVADGTLVLAQKMRFVLKMIGNIVGKGEKADFQHFLLFPQCFQMISPLRIVLNDHSNLKDFADDKIDVTCKMNFVMGSAAFSPFYTPVKDGTYYGITRGGRAGGV